MRGEGSASVEQLLAEAIEKNDEETSVAKINDPRTKRVFRDALEHAEQAFQEADRTSELAVVHTLKSILDENGSLVIEGEEVREIRKQHEEEDSNE